MNNVSLFHHGILGMRWGIRRYQPYPEGSINGKMIGEAARKAAAKNRHLSDLQQAVANYRQGAYEYVGGTKNLDRKKMTTYSVDTNPEQDVAIKKGSIVQHITTNAKTELGKYKSGNNLYVSTNDVDNKNYAGVYAATRMTSSFSQRVFAMKYKATQDLLSPSRSKRIENFLNLYMSDPVSVSKDIAKFERAYGMSSESSRKIVKKYMNMSLDDLAYEGYNSFASSWTLASGSRDKYFEILKSKGYNAVIDDNDITTGSPQAIAPLLIFDAKEKLSKVSVTELTKADIRKNIEEWVNIKHSQI